MRRYHLLEIHEQWWCPERWRRYVTDVLQTGWTVEGPVYALQSLECRVRRLLGIEPAAPLVRPAWEGAAWLVGEAVTLSADGGDGDTPKAVVLDLCSGTGGPTARLAAVGDDSRGGAEARELRGVPAAYVRQLRRTRYLLTDLHPPVAAYRDLAARHPHRLAARHTPTNALELPRGVATGCRTLHGSFHHFPPGEAVRLLADAVEKRDGIAYAGLGTPLTDARLRIAEVSERTVTAVVCITLLLVPLCLLTLVRRPSPGRLWWTVVVPVVPLILLLDGVVSCLRTYTVAEVRGLLDRVPHSDTYLWRHRSVACAGPLLRVHGWVGVPKEKLAETLARL